MFLAFQNGELIKENVNIENLFEKMIDFTLIKDSKLELAYFKDDEKCKIKLIEKLKSLIIKNKPEEKIKYYTKGQIIYLRLESIYKCNDDYYIILQFLNVEQIVQIYKDDIKVTTNKEQIKAPVKLARTIMDVLVYLFQEQNKKTILNYLKDHKFQLIYPRSDKNLYILSFIQQVPDGYGKRLDKFFFNNDAANQIVGNCILNFYTNSPSVTKGSDYNYTKTTFDLMRNSGYSQSHIYFWELATSFIHGYMDFDLDINKVDGILKLYEEMQTEFESKSSFCSIKKQIKRKLKENSWEMDSLENISAIVDFFNK